MTADTAWHKSACVPCENNCGIQIQTDGSFSPIDRDTAIPEIAALL
ncbi:hypothetical protein [Streptomyces sp. LN549]